MCLEFLDVWFARLTASFSVFFFIFWRKSVAHQRDFFFVWMFFLVLEVVIATTTTSTWLTRKSFWKKILTRGLGACDVGGSESEARLNANCPGCTDCEKMCVGVAPPSISRNENEKKQEPTS